jgi:hypothetical protein
MAARGQPKTRGRRKGTPNKLNADVKAMILAALAAKGGQKYLEKQADENPTAFLTLVGKIIPLQVTGKDCGALRADALRHSSRSSVRSSRWRSPARTAERFAQMRPYAFVGAFLVRSSSSALAVAIPIGHINMDLK